MGSSYDACYPAVTELGRAGVAAIMLDAAELLHFRSNMLGHDTLLVAVSQSGESAEVVRMAEGLRQRGRSPDGGRDHERHPGTPLASLADLSIDTRAGDETGPSTMTFAGSLVVVAALGRVLAGAPARRDPGAAGDRRRARGRGDRRACSRQPDLPERLVSWLDDRETVVILGRGPARAAAEMGALTLKEAVGMPVESLQTAQFRHGPLELAGPELAAIVIATEPETLTLDLSLADELLEGRGAASCSSPSTMPAAPTRCASRSDRLDRALAPAVSIVPSQLLAWRLAALHGRRPGAYYRALKVTTRE